MKARGPVYRARSSAFTEKRLIFRTTLLSAQDVHIGFRGFCSNAIKLLLCRIQNDAEEKLVEIRVIKGDAIEDWPVQFRAYFDENESPYEA
jgi:hypothetical protein